MQELRLSAQEYKKLHFIDVDFQDSYIGNCQINKAGFKGVFEGSLFSTCSLVDSWFSLMPGTKPPRVLLSNLSGALVPWLDIAQPADNFNNYFWADWPPMREENNQWYKANDNFPFFGVETMATMAICRPPRAEDGTIVPRELRKLRIPDYECERMSAEAAIRGYPEAYAKIMLTTGYVGRQ